MKRGLKPGLRLILTPIYGLFKMIVGIKNFAYNRGWKKPVRVEARVISIGGLSFGGAGKSPMTLYLAQKLVERGGKSGSVAVVSRGYRRRTRGLVIVSDGRKVLAGVHQTGDELHLIAKRVPGAAVIADEVRERGARRAVDIFGAKVILLDDGFQRRGLGRDVDIVMLEAGVAAGEGVLYLREGLSSLKRADAVVILDASEEQKRSARARLGRFEGLRVFFGRRKVRGIYRLADDKREDSRRIAGKRVSAFCGLAHPERFLGTLEETGLHSEKLLIFPDHCDYKERQLGRVARFFTESGAEVLITTEKDAVKLPPVLYSLPIYYLSIDLEMEDEAGLLDVALGEK